MSQSVLVVIDSALEDSIVYQDGPWTKKIGPQWFNNTSASSGTSPGSFHITFTGNAIALYGRSPRLKKSQEMTVTIDEEESYKTTFPIACSYCQWWQSPTLDDGTHTIQLDGLTRTVLDFAAVTVKTASLNKGQQIIVDDNDASMVYSENWMPSRGEPASLPFHNSTHRSNTVRSSVSFKFTGLSIAVYGVMPVETSGFVTARYTLDSTATTKKHEPPEDPPRGLKEQQNFLLYSQGSLDATLHTLLIEIEEVQNLAYSLDYVVYTHSPELEPFSGTAKIQATASHTSSSSSFVAPTSSTSSSIATTTSFSFPFSLPLSTLSLSLPPLSRFSASPSVPSSSPSVPSSPSSSPSFSFSSFSSSLSSSLFSLFVAPASSTSSIATTTFSFSSSSSSSSSSPSPSPSSSSSSSSSSFSTESNAVASSTTYVIVATSSPISELQSITSLHATSTAVADGSSNMNEHTGKVIGFTVGSVASLAAFIIAAMLCWKRRRARRRRYLLPLQEIDYSAPTGKPVAAYSGSRSPIIVQPFTLSEPAPGSRATSQTTEPKMAIFRGFNSGPKAMFERLSVVHKRSWSATRSNLRDSLDTMVTSSSTIVGNGKPPSYKA